MNGYTNRRCRCEPCCEASRTYQRAYVAANRERLNANTRYKRQRDLVKVRAREREYRERRRLADPEGYRAQEAAYMREWYRANNEVARAIVARGQARRKARLRGVPSESYDRRAIYDQYDGICHLCALPVGLGEYTLDHVVPLALGGPDIAENLRPAHRSCNSSKGARALDTRASLEGEDGEVASRSVRSF